MRKESEGRMSWEDRIHEIKRRAENKKEVIKRRAETEARQEELEDQFKRYAPTLGDELKRREPTSEALPRGKISRACTEAEAAREWAN
jgi:hypothetical protein